MQRRFRLLIGLFAVILCLATPVARVGAQTLSSLDQVKGLKLAVLRVYTGDPAALLAALKDPANAKGIYSTSGFVLQFDNSGDAKDGLKLFASQINSITGQISGGAQVQPTKVDKIGDESMAFTGPFSQDGIQGNLDVVLARKGSYVQAAMVIAVGEDALKPAASFVKAMSGRDSSGDVKTDASGLHTGGIWNKFPESKDVPNGMTPQSDDQVFPETSS